MVSASICPVGLVPIAIGTARPPGFAKPQLYFEFCYWWSGGTNSHRYEINMIQKYQLQIISDPSGFECL